MFKKLLPFTLLLAVAVMLSACNSTANELVDYYNNETKEIAKIDEEFVLLQEEYILLTSEENEIELYEELLSKRLLPKSQEIVDYAKGVELKEDEIQELHELLIASVEHRHQAFESELEAVKEYFETGSEEKFDESAQSLENYIEKQQAFDNRLEELIEEYEIEITEK